MKHLIVLVAITITSVVSAMTVVTHDDGSRTLTADDGKALRIKGSGDERGVKSVRISKWADIADWEEFVPTESGENL